MTRLINEDRRRFLAAAAASLVGLEFTMLRAPRRPHLTNAGPLSALRGANAWINSPALTADGLQGKVALVDFCTYTCVNWLRTLPYVRAWAEKYAAHGLVVIGAHTPEFGFEHDLENVRRALKVMRVQYPIAVDNDYAIWNGFSNHYWPALYLLDPKGTIRFTHFGEEAYEESERMIQLLLAEAGAGGFSRELVSVEPRGLEVAADWSNVASGETYLGTDQAEHFVRNVGRQGLRLNEWTLAGDWKLGSKAALLEQPNGKIQYRFHARDVNLVMGPAVRGESVRFQVRVDGQPVTGGTDVDAQGQGTVSEQRTYQLIRQRQPPPIADRQFEIEFLDPGVEAFCFTFG
jgi:thiol-disulfide isomerase/thioredoxin